MGIVKHPRFDTSRKYEKEDEFNDHLGQFLDGKLISTESRIKDLTKGNTRKLTTSVREKRTEIGDIPDITCRFNSPEIETYHREIDSPFYIENKMSPKAIHDNFHQLLKYHYTPGSASHQSLEKYGDNFVAFSCPQFLEPGFKFDAEEGWFNTFQLKRTLWKLGIGVLSKCQKRQGTTYEISFNEQDILYIHSEGVIR